MSAAPAALPSDILVYEDPLGLDAPLLSLLEVRRHESSSPFLHQIQGIVTNLLSAEGLMDSELVVEEPHK
jgi:hypothetical protein